MKQNHKTDLNNNRGAALVSVIIALAVVSLLGTVILYATYSGLTMRMVARTSANTFYSAESAMDEMVAGLEQDMSDVYVDAYTVTMTNYGSFSTVSDIEYYFKQNFILDMVDILHQTYAVDQATGDNTAVASLDDARYSTARLKSYITSAASAGATITVTYDTERAGGNLLETLEDGLILRNVKLIYQKDGYESVIVTDIKIASPQVDFALISNMPDISDYCYIADEGIDLTGNITLTLKGSAYSGNNGTDTLSVNMQTGSTLDATGSSLLIANGDIVMNGTATLTTGDQDSESTRLTDLWAKNIEANPSSTTSGISAGNKITLKGRSYIADDVTLNGSANELTLAGQYYGFSSRTAEAGQSSAIIVNGANSVLDMSGLDTLVVAGTAFVNAGDVTAKDGYSNNDVITGDSIALKSNQYAYMVPTECSGITQNPMSYSQYNALIEDANWISKALDTSLSSINRAISSYGTVTIQPVFEADGSDGTVYLYLSFSDVDDASEYFKDVYESDSTVGSKVRSYVDNYLSSVKFNINAKGESQMTRLITGGSYLTNGTLKNGKWEIDYSNDSDSAGIIAQELGNYSNTYTALCTKLVTSSTNLNDSEKNSTVFNNLIEESKINDIFTYDSADGATIDHAKRTVTFDTVNGVTAIIVDNDGLTNGVADGTTAYTYTYEATTSSGAVTTSGAGIIIATGDVIVKGNWDGLIICKGKLNVIAGSTLSSSTSKLGTAFRMGATMKDSSGNVVKVNDEAVTFSVQNFFCGGENYRISTGEDESDSLDMSDVRNCVSYENWESQ